MERRATDSRIDRLMEKMDEVVATSVRIECDTKTTAATVKKLDHTVHGNGVIGLDERVRNLEANQRMATSAAMKVAQWLMPIALTVMGAGAIVWIKDALGMAVNK